MIKHKHYDAIIAWAGGADIEMHLCEDNWLLYPDPCWSIYSEFRVKKALKPDLVREALIVNSLSAGPLLYAAAPDEANIVLVFDGETNKLKQCTFKGA